MKNATVVGSGPNGLACAITLVEAGISVSVLEAEKSFGGSARSMELTLPGYIHDHCAAVHPMAACSPFFTRLPLADFGLKWLYSPVSLAHPLDDGTAVLLHRSIRETAVALGIDKNTYAKWMTPWVHRWSDLAPDVMAPPLGFPKHPVLMARFGMNALRSARGLVDSLFQGERARALFGGIAGHSGVPFSSAASAAIGMILGAAGHAIGWPIFEGGTGRLVQALISYLESKGGKLKSGICVKSLSEFSPEELVFLNITPRQLIRISENKLPRSYLESMSRFRYGPGVFKLDFALSGPIPWKAKECALATTVHIGGTFEEIEASEGSCWKEKIPEHPFVILAQPSLIDPTRAPEGRHTIWAYCHVPLSSTVDMTDRIIGQIERFAPGFRDLIIEKSAISPAEMEKHNANRIGGDINGGAAFIRQILFRPIFEMDPYRTPIPRVFLCSSSTPPGGGVHGMCGVNAAKSALGRFL